MLHLWYYTLQIGGVILWKNIMCRFGCFFWCDFITWFFEKSYAKIDHNFSFSDGGNTGGGGGNQQGGGSQQYITVSPNNSILDMGKGIDLSYSGLDHIKSSVFSDDYAKN